MEQKNIKKTVRRNSPNGSSFYQRYRDSNPDIQSQSLLCYLYTIPLSALCFADGGYYIRFSLVCQYLLRNFFGFLKIFYPEAIPASPLENPEYLCYHIGNTIGIFSEVWGADMRAYYFLMKFLRSFFIGFCAAAAILTVVAAVGLVVYTLCL